MLYRSVAEQVGNNKNDNNEEARVPVCGLMQPSATCCDEVWRELETDKARQMRPCSVTCPDLHAGWALAFGFLCATDTPLS